MSLQAVRSILLRLPLLIMLLAPGCAAAAGAAVSRPPLQFIVEADQLPALLTEPGVVLLAAASKDETGPLGYVNHAIRVDEDAWADFTFSADNLVDYRAWSAMIGRLGIEGGSRVVVYDDGELKFAARIRFLLAHFGVTDASIVNGGFAAMRPLIASGALSGQSGSSVPAARNFTAHEVQQPIPIIFREAVAAAALSTPPTVTLIDVRTAGEFDGTVLIPPDRRGGHIPGAQNLPIAGFFVPGHPDELMSPATLVAFLASARLLPDQRIIVYCQDGAKSSLAALALLNAGFRHFALYFPSYRNWQEDPDLPIEK